jgi:hypothetical protein
MRRPGDAVTEERLVVEAAAGESSIIASKFGATSMRMYLVLPSILT